MYIMSGGRLQYCASSSDIRALVAGSRVQYTRQSTLRTHMQIYMDIDRSVNQLGSLSSATLSHDLRILATHNRRQSRLR